MAFDNPNITNMTAWMQYNNTVTDNWFGLAILIVFFIVMFLALKNYSTEQAFATASFASAIVAVLLRVVGLVGDNVVIGMAILAVLGLVFLYVAGNRKYTG